MAAAESKALETKLRLAVKLPGNRHCFVCNSLV
jgi:hypothetical protein